MWGLGFEIWDECWLHQGPREGGEEHEGDGVLGR